MERRDALALLALLLFARSLLDPWNTIYYVLPAILALVSWEALTRDGLPIGAMAISGLTYVSFVDARRTRWAPTRWPPRTWPGRSPRSCCSAARRSRAPATAHGAA